MSKSTLTAKEARKKKENTIKIAVAIIVIILIAGIAIWAVLRNNGNENIVNTSGDKMSGENIDNNESGEKQVPDKNEYQNVENNPIVTMEMEDGGVVKIVLYPKIAPQTVANFISLINQGFYNGLIFHRVIPDFMAQGGDPSGDGTGGPGYGIYGEFSANGFENNLSHKVGVISMARADDYNSGGSQFFIVTGEDSYQSLDGNYAAFGEVIEGMEYVYNIVNSKVIRTDFSKDIEGFAYGYYAPSSQAEYDKLYAQFLKENSEKDRPKDPPVIKSMTVDTFGYEYNEPIKY